MITSKENIVVAKSALWYTVGGFISKSIGFITIPLFTRILSTDEFGAYSNYNSWMLILMVVCGMELYNTINRARFDFSNDELDSYQFSCLLTSGLLTAALFLLFLSNQALFSSLLMIEARYIYVLFVYLLFRPALDMYLARQQVVFKYKIASVLSLGTALAGTLISLLLTVTQTEDRLMGRIVGQYAPAIVAGVILWCYSLSRCKKISLEYIKYAVKLSIPLIVSTLSTQILIQSDRIIVNQVFGENETAYLSLATSASYIILTLIQCFGYAWSPWLMDKLNAGDHTAIRTSAPKILWLFSCLTIVINLLSPEIVWVLGGAQYTSSISIIPVNITTCLISFISNQYVIVETYKKNVKWAALATLGCASINVALGYAIAVRFGFESVCYATLLTNTILVGIHVLITRRMHVGDVFSLKSFGPPLALSFVSIPLSLSLFSFGVARYVLVIAMILSAAMYIYKAMGPLLLSKEADV